MMDNGGSVNGRYEDLQDGNDGGGVCDGDENVLMGRERRVLLFTLMVMVIVELKNENSPSFPTSP